MTENEFFQTEGQIFLEAQLESYPKELNNFFVENQQFVVVTTVFIK